MSVTRAELDELHQRLRAEIPDPRVGIYGPGSAMWRLSREGALFLGGGRAALLQLAHPFVAHAVAQHSRVQTDPMGRFKRTFEHVFAMVFGDLDTALAHSRGVHAVHLRIRGAIDEQVGRFAAGDRYDANDPAGLLWVHATLLDTSVLVYELVVRRLSLAEKDAAYQESKRFAYLFGLTDAQLPADWIAFQAYMQAMFAGDTIRVGVAARELRSYLFAPPGGGRRAIFKVLEAVTAGLLPERLREEFGFRWGLGDRALFHTTVRGLRASLPLLPPRLRHTPAYVAAQRRLAGKTGPDRTGKFLEELLARLITPAPREG